MNARMTLLFSGILIAASSGAAQAALQPQDPDQAPIASVDRFSEKAATFLVRSADNHLPGPNEPIDFDTPDLSTLGLSPTGKLERYYNLVPHQRCSTSCIARGKTSPFKASSISSVVAVNCPVVSIEH